MRSLAAGTKNLKYHRKPLLERRAIIARHSVQSASTASNRLLAILLSQWRGKREEEKTGDRKKSGKALAASLRTVNKTGDFRYLTGDPSWCLNGTCAAACLLPCCMVSG